jgi:hypothetical protein
MRKRGYLLISGVIVGLSTVATSSLVSAQSSPEAVDASGPVSPSARIQPTPSTPAAPSTAPPPPVPTLSYRPVDVHVDGFFSWALLDRRTGTINGSPNRTATNSTESMIKVWIVSDFLRRAAARNQQPTKSRLAQARTAIRDSDDDAAQSLYVAGGRDAVVDRMIRICRLSDTKIAGPRGLNDRGWWSYTRISARDAVRVGECVKNGTAAGSRWTPWVLEEMSKVRGTAVAKDQHARRGGGRWGIIDGLPKAVRDTQRIGIKNGWTLINADGKWHVNCLAVAEDWVLAVLMRYPGNRGLRYGADVCKHVAAQLVSPRASGTS